MLKEISVVRLCSSQREEVMAAIGSRDLRTVAEISSVRGTRTVGAVQGGEYPMNQMQKTQHLWNRRGGVQIWGISVVVAIR